MIIARHVDVIENDVKLIGFNGEESNNNINDNAINDSEYLSVSSDNENDTLINNKANDLNDDVFEENDDTKINKFEESKQKNVSTPLRRSNRVRTQTDLISPKIMRIIYM